MSCSSRPAALIALALGLAGTVPAPLQAGETAETIRIRQVLEKDRSGRRRGDAELAMSAYDEERFAVYDGDGSIDAREWSVRHPTFDDYATALRADLATRRYELERGVLLINVWKDKAFAAVLDSGVVTDRARGESHRLRERSLWTFRKADDEWRATGVVFALGDTIDGPAVGRVEAEDVAAALREDAGEWSAGNLGGILAGLDEEAVAVDCYFSSNPAKWLTELADRDEIEAWLEDRLGRLDYDVERVVLHAVSKGDAAVAVTRDHVSATYAAGDARVGQERLTVWLLKRSGGRWRATWMLWKAKSFGALAGAATALY